MRNSVLLRVTAIIAFAGVLQVSNTMRDVRAGSDASDSPKPAEEPSNAGKPEGFGAVSKGGAGGKIIKVTTLADSGPGSLRDAMELKEPRIIEFAVEGTIKLKGEPIQARYGRVTLDGSTAPGQGITILGHGIWFVGKCEDMIVRHLRIRVLKGGSNGDGILFYGTMDRILVDHCSIMWAPDENFTTWGKVTNLTCQWSIIAEGQVYGDHPKGVHSDGWLSGSNYKKGSPDRMTIHHCLFAHNMSRNPLVNYGMYDIVNNVFYNWEGGGSKINLGARANMINNVYVPGPETILATPPIRLMGVIEPPKVHLAGNVFKGARSQKRDWQLVAIKGGHSRKDLESVKRFDTPKVATQSAHDAYELVLKHVGPKVRDKDDLRVIREVKERKGHLGRRNEWVDPNDRLFRRKK